MEMMFTEAGAVRAFEAQGKRVLDVLAAPFGSPDKLDKLGQYLHAGTDFMIDVGDRRPALYMHGLSPMKRGMHKPTPIGPSTVTRIDEKGLWMRIELDDSELSNRTWDAALEGNAKASSGSINYLVRPQLRSGKIVPGAVRVWPIAEVSVWDAGKNRVPVSDDAVVIPLRALFDRYDIDLPQSFEAGKDKDAVEDNPFNRTIKTGDITMTEEERIAKAVADALAAQKAADAQAAEAQVALRAEVKTEVEAELKADPAYRATFNINKIEGDKGLEAGELETFAFVRGMIEDGKIVADGGVPQGHAKRVLEESEATEMGSMVPEDLLNKIHVFRGKYSIVRRAGMTIYQTDKLTFVAPAETTAMTALADIAEEGAYVANEAAFVGKSVSMKKKGSLLAITEEALEDQDLFTQWLTKAAGKALALAENIEFNALTTAIDGVEVAGTHAITDGEILACYYGLDQENRDGAIWCMNDLTLAYLRAKLVATPRAYGEFGFNPMSMGEAGEAFLNKPVFTNANWDPITTAADDVKVVDFVNPDECIYWVERRGLSIFVDPYTARAAAGVINYLPSARFAGVTVNAAALSGIDDTV